MSIFYLLPPRPFLAQHLTGLLGNVLPGLHWTPCRATELTEALSNAACRPPDVYVIFREELPKGEDTSRALIDGFGGEPGDEVVEVCAGIKPGELTASRWRLNQRDLAAELLASAGPRSPEARG